GTTDVERTHGELGAGFTDGLGGDDADRFTEFDQATGREVAAVAMDADALLAFAGEHRADADAINAGIVDIAGLVLVDFFIRTNEEFFRVRRIDDVIARESAHEAVREFHDFVFAFINRADGNAVGGAAIFFLDDDILGDVHEF